MVQIAANYWFIQEASGQSTVLLKKLDKIGSSSVNLVHTSRPLLAEFDRVDVSKTGFTNPAGWCVALLVERNKQTFAVVVLGSKNHAQRLDTVRNLMYNHINDAAELPMVDDPSLIPEIRW